MSNYTGQIQIDFVHDPTSASFTWVDITNRGRSANYRRGRSYERNQVEAGGGTVKLRNDDGALDPTNAPGAFSPNVLPFRRIQHNVTVAGPGTVPIFTGLVERWPQEWEAGYGYAPVQVVDIFAWLALGDLRSCYEQEVLADAPAVFYPFAEASGATSAGDISGNNVSQLVVNTQADSGGHAIFGTATGIPTDGATALQLNTTLTTGAGDDRSGEYLTLQLTAGDLSGYLSTTNGLTCEAWVRIDPNLSTIADRNLMNATQWWVPVIGFTGPGSFTEPLPLAIVWDHTTSKMHLACVVEQTTFGAVTLDSSGTNLNDGLLHHVAVTVDTSNNIQFYIDGVAKGTATNGFGFGSTMMVGGRPAGIQYGQTLFRGTIAHAAAYKAAISGARIAAHYTAGATAFAGETVDSRIARILGYAGWTATTALDACTTTMLGATDLAGKSALAAIQDAQAAEGGVFFASKAGVLTYKSRRTRMRTTTSSATFGEDGNAYTNLITNPSFEVDLSGWSAVGALAPTVTNPITATIPGDLRSALITWQTGSNSGNAGFTYTANVTAGQTYTWTATVLALTTNVQLHVYGTGVGASNFTSAPSVSGVTRLSVTFTATATGTVNLQVDTPTSTLAGAQCYVNDVQLEFGPIAHAYCDGTKGGCVWTGTPHASTSTHAAEVPWLNVAFDFDPTYVYNDVQITRTGSATVSASSSTSRAHYGQRTLPLSIGTQSDVETQDAANWLLNASLAPHLRVRSITVDCLATPGAWAAVLPLEIGSRVTVNKRPANGTTITANSFVESISWDIVDGKRALCTFELSPIPLQALIADDATYGICDSTLVAAW